MQNEQGLFKTFAFLDIETTRLQQFECRTKIAQLTITACSVEHLLELKDVDAVPRVLHKLSLCVNPRKLIKLDTSEVNGLMHCLVAHNGNKFDFPEIMSYCKKLEKPLLESLICCDSLFVFMKIDEINEEQQLSMRKTERLDVEHILKSYDSDENLMTITQLEMDFIENVPSNGKKQRREHIPEKNKKQKISPKTRKNMFPMGYHKLREIYKRFFGTYPENSHDSEADVKMCLCL